MRALRLRYVTDQVPGIHRVRNGKGFQYISPNQRPLRNPRELARIKSLAIPPAWTDVWICPFANGHLQTTGRDGRGRKQYRYHPLWRVKRDETKFSRMIPFLRVLPRIRAQVRRDLSKPGLPREKVLAAVVRLLETTLIRVGKEEYAQANQSYGLTTMRNRHVKVRGATMRFQFRGKSGIYHAIDLDDGRLARTIQKCREVPGAKLFQYMDDQDRVHVVDSGDVNDYLRRITGEEVTAKDFRTMAGTTLAALELYRAGRFHSRRQAKAQVNRAVERVADRLGNRVATCRKYYIHPALLEAYLNGTLREAFMNKPVSRETLLTFLRRATS